MGFCLHQNLINKEKICDLPLSSVLFENNLYYPWILLVPRRENILRLIDLSLDDQLQLTKELDYAQKAIWKEFSPTQLNVATIGNKTAQLHIHVIARYENDPAWPATVWDHPSTQSLCNEKVKRERMSKIAYHLKLYS